MSDSGERLIVAEAESIAARKRVTRTLSQLQSRLKPRHLVREAADQVSVIGTAAANAGIDTARRYPSVIAGIAAAVGLIAARRPLARLFRRDGGATRYHGKS